MTTINNLGAGVPRLADSGQRLPFNLLDKNMGGVIDRGEMREGLQRVFPGLSDKQCNAIYDQTKSMLQQRGMLNSEGLLGSSGIDRNAWASVEETVLQSANGLMQQNAMQTGRMPTSGWLNATGLPPQGPAYVGQNQIPLPPNLIAGGGYMPRNDYAVTGYNPYQYPIGMPQMPQMMLPGLPSLDTPGQKMAKGAGRGLLGFLKMIPVVGNIINGIDFIKDIPKAFSTFSNPTKTFGEKMKAGADLLFHGAGMLVPQVGAGYDMAQGAVRVAGGAMEAMGGRGMYQPWNQLPPYQFSTGGVPPLYNMQYGGGYQPSVPMMYNQFPNYSQYPAYPVQQQFMPSWGQQMYAPSTPYPIVPYGTNLGQYGMQMQNYDPYMGSPYGSSYNPYQQFGTPQDAQAGMIRSGIGMLKMAPGIGNIINGVDFIRDLGQLASGQQPLKNAADLLFHGIGMIVPQVGGAYDMAQGTLRAAAGGAGFNYGGFPPFGFNTGGYAPSIPFYR